MHRVVSADRTAQRGFSVAEMIVSIAIITIITAVGSFAYLDFRDRTILDDVATSLLLDIKEAQSQGVASVENPRYPGRYNVPMGLYVNVPALSDRYAIFTDNPTSGTNNPRWFDGGTADCVGDAQGECLEVHMLPDGFAITDLCVTDSAGNRTCNSSVPSLQEVSVTYVRPNLDARILESSAGAFQSQAEIEITSRRGRVEVIVVTHAGLVYAN